VSEQKKQVVRRYFEELDRAKASPVDLCAPGYTFQAARLPAMDLQGAEQFTKLFFSAFPDLAHPVDDLIAEGDKVASRCRYEGTHTGADFMGVPASGRHFSAVGAGIVRVVDGKVAEFWVSPDRITIMQQIGALAVED
jgi:predicted ester cyclase